MPRSIRLLSVLLLLLGSAGLVGCGKRPLLYSYQPVPTDGWACTDTLRFLLPAPESEGEYALSVGVRFTDQMPYRELWLVLEQRTEDAAAPGTTTAHRDTLHLPLASESGRWLTKGVALHETEAVCTTAHLLPHRPTQLLVYHVMRSRYLGGITEVGVKVEELSEPSEDEK